MQSGTLIFVATAKYGFRVTETEPLSYICDYEVSQLAIIPDSAPAWLRTSIYASNGYIPI